MPDLRIRYSTLKTCLVSIPLRFANLIFEKELDPQSIVIKVIRRDSETETPNPKTYFGWNGSCSIPAKSNDSDLFECLEIDSEWAFHLGFKENDIVFATFESTDLISKVATRIFVTPFAFQDWEILELNAGYLEEQFMNQARIVYPGQILTIWIHQRMFVNLKVTMVDPSGSECLRLALDSEVVVQPLADPRKEKKSTGMMKSRVCSLFPANEKGEKECGALFIGLHLAEIGFKSNQLVLVQNVDYSAILDPFKSETGEIKRKTNLGGVFLRICSSDGLYDSPEFENGAVVSKKVRDYLSASLYSKLRITAVNEKHSQDPCRVITLVVDENNTLDALAIENAARGNSFILTFQEWVSNSTKGSRVATFFDKQVLLFVNYCVKVCFKDTDGSIPTSILEIPSFVNVTQDDVKNLVFEVEKTRNVIFGVSQHANDCKIKGMPGYQDLVEQGQSYIETIYAMKNIFNINVGYPGGLLVSGAQGTGKKSLISAITYELQLKRPYFLIKVQSLQVRFDSVSKTKDALEKLVKKAIWHQPCILYFESFDLLLGKGDENDTYSKDRTNQLCLIFESIIYTSMQEFNIFFIASVQEKSDLYPLVDELGIFGKEILLKPPEKKRRIAILSHLLESENESIADLALKMDGFSISDIVQVFEQARHHQKMEKIIDESAEVELDFGRVLKDFKPVSFGNSRLQESLVEWISVGGMEEAKDLLLQTLKWPTRYPQIFSQTSIRMRSGILLYGYPGCGKTMLGNAVAKECGLNFIPVKGPELLNKYIGASEKAVRDVFQIAKAAKPCLLFFDEFDSIAPRRGHDNSGVTDRVVNQFLTEMDGAEGLEGVYVLATTSRPDLIDPALLRPGRLDKAIFCDFPDKMERMEILEKMALDFLLDERVSLLDVAQRTSGYTGADLKGLLNSAHRMALDDRKKRGVDFHGPSKSKSILTEKEKAFVILQGDIDISKLIEMIGSDDDSTLILESNITENPSTTDHLKIFRKHIELALSMTKPSVLLEDQQRLLKIYQIFRGEQVVNVSQIGQKISFAST